MRIIELRNKPVILFIFLFILFLFVGKIPIKEYIGPSNYTSDKLEGILLYSALILIVTIIIYKLRIPHSYFQSIDRKDYLYYLPVFIYIFIYSNGFSVFRSMSSLTLYSGKMILYVMETLSSSMLEEILFRGLILGVLLNKFYKSKHGILKSIIISSLIFGIMHLLNIWTIPDQIFARGSINQVFAAFCIGVMYCSVYLKTKSIFVLGVLHFISNFFAGIGELTDSEVIVNSISTDKTIIEIIISNILTVIIFGLPLVIGLYIFKKIDRKEVIELVNSA